MKEKIGLKFKYRRIMNRQPSLKPSVETYGTLGEFIDAVGVPEFTFCGDSALLFWNFVGTGDNAHRLFSAYATVPTSREITRDLEIDIALTGPYSEKQESFAGDFMDHTWDVQNGRTAQSVCQTAALPSVVSVNAGCKQTGANR